MEIAFNFKFYRYVLNIGHKGNGWAQKSLVTFIREEYDEHGMVLWAKILFSIL